MALRVARGMFRLWLILSMLWLAVVAFMARDVFENIDYAETRRATAGWDPSDPLTGLHGNPSDPFTKRCSNLWWPDRERLDCSKPTPEEVAVQKATASKEAAEKRQSTIWQLSLLAFLPPAFVLAFGSALVWAFRGFR
jgi:hypothetical protein